MGNVYTVILFNPILNVLMVFYHTLLYLHVSNTLGWSIVLLTIAIRLLLYPLIASQIQASKKMQAVTPHLNALKEKHKGDSATLQKETMKLYQEHGINPVAGCLPLLIQFPIIIALYQVLQLSVGTNATHITGVINTAVYAPWLRLVRPIDQNFFGLPLGQSPSHLLSHIGFVVLLVPIVTALLQLVQSKMMFQVFENKIQAVEKEASQTKNNELIKEVKKEDDFATAFQSQSMFIFPLLIGYTSFAFALGLSLYWNTFTIFGILQQYQIQGLGGLKDWLPKKK